MSEVDKLLDALERQSEVIAGLRNELYAKDKRIADMEAGIVTMSGEAAHTISGLTKRIAELESAANIAYVKKLACEVQP